jgi:hypothetical protein
MSRVDSTELSWVLRCLIHRPFGWSAACGPTTAVMKRRISVSFSLNIESSYAWSSVVSVQKR